MNLECKLNARVEEKRHFCVLGRLESPGEEVMGKIWMRGNENAQWKRRSFI